MTKPHTTLSEAIRALEPIDGQGWDYDAGFAMGIASAADLVEQHEAQEPALQQYRVKQFSGAWSEWRNGSKLVIEAALEAKDIYDVRNLYAQPTLAATQAGDVKVISIGHGATLQRQAKTTGAVGWLMYNEHGLVRSLDVFETQLVESALAAMSPTTTRSE